ncbi:nucleotidyltransferase domain-containing protein [Candidatus Pacearchaeota archaeon]|nr:nucleotidyltransferase domain-containing protein [Candidatus Pacearchaeota archaeon]
MKNIIINKELKIFMKRLKSMPNFHRVKFVFLFGSYSLGDSNIMSDIDIAVYYQGNSDERFKFRLALLGKLPDYFDIHILQDLPIFIQKEVIKGKIIYSNDSDLLFEVSYYIIKRFEDFKKYYYDYIELEPLI